jgi:hypothetical protein
VPQLELFIGLDSIEVVPKERNLGFVLNRNLTPVNLYKMVCQRIYSVLRCVKPHARYTLFGVRKKLVVSPIMPHINYGNVVSQLLPLHRRGDLTLRSILVYVMFMVSLVGSMFLILSLLLSVFRWRLI